jgi:L-threonylcarbamoyladenylate synthase
MTSANLSGQADGVLVDMALALAQVGDAVDYILAGAPDGTTKSSTILDLSNPSQAGGARILRHGDITAADLGAILPILQAA